MQPLLNLHKLFQDALGIVEYHSWSVVIPQPRLSAGSGASEVVRFQGEPSRTAMAEIGSEPVKRGNVRYYSLPADSGPTGKSQLLPLADVSLPFRIKLWACLSGMFTSDNT